jgi:serine/threonine protein kinase
MNHGPQTVVLREGLLRSTIAQHPPRARRRSNRSRARNRRSSTQPLVLSFPPGHAGFIRHIMAASLPKKIGKYDVIDVIGKGGMGIVYRAQDPFLDRTVAIKIMTINYADSPDLLQRFYREAKATANLQHPNIVTVYELGEHDGSPYLAMQYLEGASLEMLLRSSEPLSLLQKIDIIVQTCHGLAYAHQRGIVHRDIKPGNIMVLKDGSVKIVDFGIARIGDTNFTRTGQFMGSLNYMSPEQLNDKLQIDGRTDVYSTGVVLYQLLTGKLPFEADNTGATLMKILNEPPPPLSKYISDYPPEVEAINIKALMKDRDQRYSSADDLALDLAQVRDRFRTERVNSHMQRAELLLQRNNLTRANDELVEVLKLDRHHTKAASLLRTLRKQLEREQSAERARQLRDQAEEAYRRKEFDPALIYLDQAISLDTTNADLQQLRAQVQTAKAELEQLRQLRQRADEALVLRKWDEALALLDQVVKLDSDNTELIELRNSIRRSRTLRADALRRAELARRAGDLTEAKLAVEEALALEPSDTTARALNAIISKEIAERSKRKKLDELVSAARKEIGLGQFTTALDLLSQAKAIDASVPEIQQLIDSATSAREIQRRRQALERACNEIEELLNRDEYSAACARADEALRSFPNDQGLLTLKSFAEKQREVASRRLLAESELVSARQLFDAGRLNQAQLILNAALVRYPDEPRLLSFLTAVTDAIAKQDERRLEDERNANERRRYINLQLSAAAELHGSGQTGQALSKLRAALLIYPDSSELKNQIASLDNVIAQKEVLRERDERERKREREEIEKTISLAQQLLDSKLSARAVAMLDDALRRFPKSDELKAQLAICRSRLADEQAEQERAEQVALRRQTEINQEIIAARRFLHSNEITQAVTALEIALEKFPDNAELKSLLELASQTRSRERAEKRRDEQQLQRRQAEIGAQIKAARALIEAKQTAKAVEALEQATRQYPESPDLASLFTAAQQSLKQERAAEEKAAREAQARRASIAAELESAKKLLKTNQLSKALASLEEALKRHPESQELRSQLAEGREQLARELAEQEKEKKRQAELRQERSKAQALLDSGQLDQAISICEAALRRLGKDEQLKTLLDTARAAVKHKKAEEKKRAEERRQEEEQNRRRERDLAVLRDLAARLSTAANQAAAEKLLREARKIAAQYPDNREIQKKLSEMISPATPAPAETEQHRRDETHLATRLLTPAEAESLVASEKAPSAAVVSVEVDRTRRGLPQPISALLRSKLVNKWTAIGALGLLTAGLTLKHFLGTSKPVAPSSFIVSIDTQPAGATVQVGNQTCVTPNCRMSLPAGEYEIHAQLEGYLPSSQPLVVDPKEPTSPVSLELIRKPPPETAGYLIVKAGVAGADVLINGQKYAQTDSAGTLRLPLDPGSYKVEVQRKQYQLPKPQQAVISTGKEITAKFKLSPLPTQAELVIIAALPNVQVRVDGHDLGLTDADGGFSQTLEPGEHEIALAQEGRLSNAIHERFTAGQPLRLDGKTFKITAPPSLVEVVIPHLPSAAVVSVDGGEKYQPTSSGEAHFRVSPGNHTIEITADGFNPKRLQSSFAAGPPTMLDGALEPTPESREWQSMENSHDPADFRRFLSDYPESKHVGEAHSRLDLLNRDEEARVRAEKLPTPREDLTERGRMLAELMGRLEGAYSARDAGQVCEIWVRCPRTRLEKLFKDADSVKQTFQLNAQIQFSGGIATGEYSRTTLARYKGKKSEALDSDAVRILFRRKEKDWLIDSIDPIVRTKK